MTTGARITTLVVAASSALAGIAVAAWLFSNAG